MIKCESVKHIPIPQFEGLTFEAILEYASARPDVMRCLPIELKEIDKLPRQYLANIVYTKVGKPFFDWVDNKIKARNAKVTSDKDLIIEMDEDIARVFQASTAVSGKFTWPGATISH